MSKAKPAPVVVDPEELKGLAFGLYQQASRDIKHGSTMEQVAIDSFRRAKAFLNVAAQVGDAPELAEPEAAPPVEFVEVPILRQLTDEKSEKVKDPVTGKVVTERVPVDRYAYAPNLPEDHPINLRFKPEDGRAISLRKGTPSDIALAESEA